MTTILDEGVGDSDLNEYLRRLPETDDFVGFARTAQLPVSVIRSAFTELIALRALATHSTGAVGMVTVPAEPTRAMLAAAKAVRDNAKPSSGGRASSTAIYRAMIAAAPPSSPSERDAALREAQERLEKLEDNAPDTDEGRRSVSIARAVWDNIETALKASRFDTVGPEAGE
jgi:hypothetical protein